MLRYGAVRTIAAVVCLLLVSGSAGLVLGAPLGTAFTYQGQLRMAGVPVNGNCDFQFSLFDAVAAGTPIGATLTASNLSLVDGRFTVQLDFGAAAFTGEARWLQIAARCPTSSGSFTTLDPRQPLTPSPYALFAPSATSAANFTGSLAGDVTGTQGATIVARLQGREVANTAPTDGQVLKFNAGLNRWEPGVDSDVNRTGYLFRYSTASQSSGIPTTTFKDVMLEEGTEANGWVVSFPPFTFSNTQSGLYLVHYAAHVRCLCVGLDPVIVAFRLALNGIEVAGSQSSTDFVPHYDGLGVALTGQGQHVSKSALVRTNVGDVLALQMAGTHIFQILDAGPGASPVSASVTIIRVE